MISLCEKSYKWGVICVQAGSAKCMAFPRKIVGEFEQKFLGWKQFFFPTTCSSSVLYVHTVLTFPLELLLVHETKMHSLSLPWYLSTVLTSTPEQQLTPVLVASPWLPLPPASAVTALSSPLPSHSWQKEWLKELLCLSCWSFSRIRFCCCLRGVMTPISPPSKPNCNTKINDGVCLKS